MFALLMESFLTKLIRVIPNRIGYFLKVAFFCVFFKPHYYYMKEQGFNTILKNSFEYYGGWCHKIADPVGGMGVQNPFDLFGVFRGKALYAEAKLIKGLYAFNFNRIEDHQWKNLGRIKKELPSSYCLFPIGFYESRKFFYVMFFTYESLRKLRISGTMSIKKKELEKYIEEDKYLTVVTKEIDGKKKKFVDNLYMIEDKLI